MIDPRRFFGLVLLACSTPLIRASDPPNAEAIMARVAANQDQADAERSHYIYVQHARIISRKGKTVMCEEVTDSRVLPSANGSKVKLLKLDGRLLHDHKYIVYSAPLEKKAGTEDDDISIELSDSDTDRQLVEGFRTDLTNDKSKDAMGARLFPLTSADQRDYQFELIGREHMNGREVFHIEFHPKDKDEFTWKGDAYVDTTAYQPVVVTTSMARKIPFAVRTLLGTNLPGLGFTVVYAPQADGRWFPVSFGTEFKIRVLFLFNREIVIDASNRDFEKTHIDSRIVASGDSSQPH
jgi:hypothetical protein